MTDEERLLISTGIGKGHGIVEDTTNKQQEFETDGKLYDESLTRETKEQAYELYEKIVKEINSFGFITIMDVVCVISKFPVPKNWKYATLHGWTRKNVSGFSIRELKDKRWAVFLGDPCALLDDI